MCTGKLLQANLVVVMMLKCLLSAALTCSCCLHSVSAHFLPKSWLWCRPGTFCHFGKKWTVLGLDAKVAPSGVTITFATFVRKAQNVFTTRVHVSKSCDNNEKIVTVQPIWPPVNSFGPRSNAKVGPGLKHGCKMLWVTWLKLFPKKGGVLFHPKWKSQKR